MVEIFDDPAGDDDVQTLLNELAGANPDAEAVARTAYNGEVLDLVTVMGVSNADVELPEVDGFDLETMSPFEPSDEEMKEKLIKDGKVPEKYWDKTVGPAQVSFTRA